MANKNFFQRLFNLSNKSADINDLETKLNKITEDFEDRIQNDVKFIDSESSSFSGHFHSDYSAIDQQLDNAALQKIYMTETWVYVAVQAIVKSIACLPLKLEKRTIYAKLVKNQITDVEEAVKQETWVDASGEQLNKLFQYPNQHTSKSEFLILLGIDLMTTGETFVYLDSDQDLELIAGNHADDDLESPYGRLRSLLAANTPIKCMYRIPPAMIKAVLKKSEPGIDYYMVQTDKGSFNYKPAEIVHIKLPNPSNPQCGLSPLIAAFKPVLLDRFSTEHMIRFYKSGARLGGVLETDKNLNKEQLSRYQRSFESSFTGRKNHHRTLILPAGMTYKSIEQNPAETALLEFCKYNREAVLAAYNVPPIKVGVMDHANYANAYIQLKMFFSDTIVPILAIIEDAFNLHKSLMPDNRSFRIKFDLSNVEALQENFKDKAEAAKAMLEAGLSVNEVRKRVWSSDPVEKGDVIIPIAQLNKPAAPQQGYNTGSLVGPSKSLVEKDAVSDSQPDTSVMTDIKPTDSSFSDRVAQLVAKLVSEGFSLNDAIDKALEVALTEGFDPALPSEENKDLGLSTQNNPELVHIDVGKKPKKDPNLMKDDEEDQTKSIPTLNEYIISAISKLSANELITEELISQLKDLYKSTYTAKARYSEKFTREVLALHWKDFSSKTEPLVVKRYHEITKFFNKYKSIVMNRYGGNLKAYGMHKSRDSEDVDSILDPSAFDDLISGYISEVDKSLLEAYRQGFADTLVDVDLKMPNNEDAIQALKDYAADRVKGISETTRDQIKSLLVDMFQKNASTGDIGQALADKFKEIDNGRAMTIARTETLTAVSLGKEEKRDQFVKEFPDKVLKKMWVSSRDNLVRDSHQEVDGESVEQSEKFSNGLMFPRDPDGSAEEVINCRCDVIDFVEEDQTQIENEVNNEDQG